MRPRKAPKAAVCCAYLQACYLADELECFGYKANCPIYMESNGEPCNRARFDAAMDKLICKTRRKHDLLNARQVRSS